MTKRQPLLCRYCNQRIFLGKWGNRWYPIDPTPHPDGRWTKIRGHWKKMVGVRYETALHNNTPLHPPHNCPARPAPVVGEKESA
ncbi:hypothetical protein [Corynebacterium glutamicum]|uniref:hypothetical protein n=1 Tax=Corynebacterium glutamicum TaxID=1718 RepID=UPI000A9AC43A|nr:hypothetical protein [Corynebacterium glutamicum]